jgi:hypothetical protein
MKRDILSTGFLGPNRLSTSPPYNNHNNVGKMLPEPEEEKVKDFLSFPGTSLGTRGITAGRDARPT